MKTESPLAAKFVGICLVAAALAISLFAIFRNEVMERLSDKLSNNAFAVKRTAPDLKLKEPVKFELRPEQNDIEFVQISNLRTGAPTVAGTPISFTLTNLGDSNSHPSVRVLLLDRQRRPVRELQFSEKDYAHPSRFEQHDVDLLLALREGESSFTATPFYPGKP